MVVVCPKCQTTNSKDAKYCRNCGTDLANVQPIPDKTDEQIKKVVNTSKTVILKIVGIIFVVLAIGIGKVIGNVAEKAAIESSNKEKEAAMIKVLQKFADDTNPNLPVMVDEITQMDQITVGPGLRIVYHQSLPKYAVNDLDQNSLETYHTTVVNNICSKEESKKLLQKNGIYEYVVNDRNGLEITNLTVSKYDCGL